MITVNNYLDKFTDIFIAEMGACQAGDIKELCDLVHRSMALLRELGLLI